MVQVSQISPGIFKQCCCDEPAPGVFTIGKTSDQPTYEVGETGQYVIAVQNIGVTTNDATVNDSTIFAPFDPGTYLTIIEPFSVIYGGGATGPATTTANDLYNTFFVANMPPGSTVQIIIGFTVDSVPPEDGIVMNRARVTIPGEFWEDEVEFLVNAPRTVDIFTVKTGSDPTTGVNEVFHNIYTNNGPDDANGLTVIDIPGSGYGSRWSLSTIAGVSITYTGGAAGPASATVAQLLAGIVVPTWPNGGQVDVAYSIHGDVAGTPNENCANVVAPPSITISDPIGAEFCLPFLVTGTANCSCSATYDVTPLDRTVGQDFTATYTLPPSGDLSCCNTVDFHTISYPTEQDAIDDTNGTDTVALATVTCLSLGTSGNFPFVAGTAGWFRYYIDVLNNGSPQPQFCSISDSNQVFGNAPLPSKHTIAISGTWTYHTVT